MTQKIIDILFSYEKNIDRVCTWKVWCDPINYDDYRNYICIKTLWEILK